MTQEPPPVAGWCAEVAEALGGVAGRVGWLAALIAEDWPDDRGREWSERTALLHRELGRSALDAADLGVRQSDPAPDDAPEDDPVAAALSGALAAARRRGPQLGGTDGPRVDPGFGVRIAELPPSDPG